MQDKPILVVLCGSNGAGKTTFNRRFLSPIGLPFVNADEIARATHPANPANPAGHAYEAMHLAERLRQDLLSQHTAFCMETVLSDTQGAKLAFLEQARAANYALIVVFMRLTSPELSQARVDHRVRHGGHDVPAEKLIARFPRTLKNADKALALADLGIVLDNSSASDPYRCVEIWQDGLRAPATSAS